MGPRRWMVLLRPRATQGDDATARSRMVRVTEHGWPAGFVDVSHDPLSMPMGEPHMRPTMDESKRSFIKKRVGLLAASGLVAGRAPHAAAVEQPDVPPSLKVQ